jgi:hypothetical protein
MKFISDQEDADEFVARIEQMINGIIRIHAPKNLIVIKVNNWFGSRWLGFSGRILGALGVWKDELTLPPFVPNRILSQRKFSAPNYDEEEFCKLLHVKTPSVLALGRKVKQVIPDTALVWFCGNSRKQGRGCVLVYLPDGASHWPWYVSWKKDGESWKVTQTLNISAGELQDLLKAERPNSRAMA